MNEPDFNNFLKVLRHEKTSRPVLFELFIADDILIQTLGDAAALPDDQDSAVHNYLNGYRKLGYDYATLPSWGKGLGMLGFVTGKRQKGATGSLNEGAVINDRASFDAHPWPAVDAAAYRALGRLDQYVPKGMKLVPIAPGGILENLIALVGFENLCYMIADEPDLVSDICEAIGTRIVQHYQSILQHDCFGAAIMNDDWGFKTQTMISTNDMRKFIFPWHKKIVETIHAAGRPAILHSCGQMAEVWDDIIDDIKYDAKHSYEDTILPVEYAYDRYSDRISILGGIDVDFLCRSKSEDIYKRAKAMLERTAAKGGYALGSGNSIPSYLPAENFLAMIRPAQEAM